MGSIFFRIYTSIVLASLIIGFATYAGIALINDHRLASYVNQVARGTFNLISQGAARHQGEKRIQWLNIITRLSKMPIRILPASALTISDSQKGQLADHQLLVIPDKGGALAEVIISIPDGKNTYLVASLNDIDESLARLTALLVLNELGRYPKEQRDQALATLRKEFGFPVERIPSNAANLDELQLERINSGDIAVVLRDAVTQDPAISVYAPFGNSGDLLALGPIPLFNWYPTKLLVGAGLVILVMMALATYSLVRPLENRLRRMADQVDDLGVGADLKRIQVTGSDAIARLAEQINASAERINSLMETQKELSLAVSHELKTPVARIKFRLTMLEEDLEAVAQSDNPFDDTLDGINNDIAQLETLLAEMLTYASLEQQRPALHPSQFSAGILFRELCEDYQSTHPELIINCTLNTEEATGDANYLRRAMDNLLSNACRYASQTVSINLGVEDNIYRAKICDDGPGIPKEMHEKVFAPYFRVDSSRNRQSGGSGLGLAIVEKIAHWHHGEVRVIADRATGTCIEFKWPAIEINDQKQWDNIS